MAELKLQNSTMLEALVPLLEVAAKLTPENKDVEWKQVLLNHAREAFGTQVLTSEMHRLSTGTVNVIELL